ncbi:hypothetical protein [Dyadobacter chenhuakuii]|uniref:Surface antigen-like protein n=1 Tax=Dyadobacter chenhuakuii TaxID=2909339 RepID=A0ABY4XHN3_9BACT|nr:hypothetical protein [Dyadobacter chenhuakuii]MCF2495849.1 hypothetical protein [Dyadobacter chenhuakuii]USJ29922.1 hypothetical protein NFI80_18875 [Dyadobacter chenhuakuii]
MKRNSLRIWLLLFCLSLTGVEMYGRPMQIPDDQPVAKADSVEKIVLQKDIIDVLKGLRKKHRQDSVKVDTVLKTGKVLFSIVPAFGYTLTSGLIGSMNVNSAFYSSDPHKTRLSSITANFIYTQYKQITIPLQASIWTRDNDLNILTDWRYFKYPQDTYGLGPNSEIKDASQIDYRHIRLHQTVLKKVTESFYAGLGFFYDYRWNILLEDTNADVTKYGLTPKSISSGPVATLVYDNRTNSINPEKGFYTSIQYRSSLEKLNSTSNWNSVVVDIRKYFNLPQGSRNTLAFWNYNWLVVSGKAPYLDLPSTGWDPATAMGRGYIQGRFRSPKLLYFETEYRMSLTRNGLLGAVVFGNAQSVSNWPANNFTKIAPGGGVGLRIKVNKKSRANVAIDYGFGMKGSRGLFVNLGEVF